MTRAAALAAACAVALALAASGSDDNPIPAGVDKNDKRAVALACIHNERLSARLSGDKAIEVDERGGARIEFLLSCGEAEVRQFLGGAQGAEHIGSALLF